MHDMTVCVCVCVWLPVCVTLHWLATALQSAAGGTHPDRKSHVMQLPWRPVRDAARIYKSMLCLPVIVDEEKRKLSVGAYCVYIAHLCACLCLTVQSAVARSSCARCETLSPCTETDTPTISYQ